MTADYDERWIVTGDGTGCSAAGQVHDCWKAMKRTLSLRLAAIRAVWIFFPLLALPAFGLQTSTPSPTPTPTPPPSPSKANTRVVGVVPAFNVATFDTNTPLTANQKFHLFWRSSLDPFTLIAPAAKAVIYSAAGLNSGYGSGASGFFKRYGAAIADGTTGRFFRSYMYPVLLHEDPRYFRIANGTKKSRTGYALTRVFVTRTDAGSNRFNWSKLLAGFSSSGLSNLYYPQENRGPALTFSNVGLSYIGEAAMNVVKEFWPDIAARRKARHSKFTPSSPPAPETGCIPVNRAGAPFSPCH
jgi:hypothetical protein